jgi:hypothetical protein
MGLPLRITFKDTTEIELIFSGEKIALTKDVKLGWLLKHGDAGIDPELVQALGRSVSLRLRM